MAEWRLLAVLYAISSVGVVGLGLPFVLLLRSCGWLTWLNVLGCSALAGILYWEVIGIFLWEGFQISYLLEGALLGVLAGVGFCIAAWPNNALQATREDARA